MNKQTKTAQLEARQAEAIQTANDNEKAARNAFISSYRQIKIFGFTLELWSDKARKAYERAQENRLAIMRQYAAILAAVPTDYTEINYIKAN